VNASANSAHVYGTTFDVAYARYKGAEKEETDKLKSVLAEVLQDLRKQKKCYVRYEFKQGCFHITNLTFFRHPEYHTARQRPVDFKERSWLPNSLQKVQLRMKRLY